MRLPFLSVLATLLVLVLCATASAEDFCVAKPRCLGTAITASQLPARLLDAQSNGQADRFFLGAATFADGPYVYNSAEPLEIVGDAGGGSTLKSGVIGSAVLRLTGGAASVTGVRVEIAIIAFTGVELSGATAHDVTVVQMLGATTGSGVVVDDGATLADSSIAINMPNTPGVTALSGDGTVSGSTISSVYAGVAANAAGGTLSVVRSTLLGPIGGLAFGSTLSVSDTLIDGRENAASSIGLAALALRGIVSTVRATRATIVGPDAGSRNTIGVFATAGTGTSTVDVSDIAMTGIGMPLMRTADSLSVANLTASRVAHGDPVSDVDTGPGATVETDRLPAPTGFADADAGNFRLLAGSPLIDAGTADAASLAGTLDRDGSPRVTDGDGDCTARVDVGAYEYQPPAPCPSLVDPPVTAPVVPQAPPVTPPVGRARPTQPRRDTVKPRLSALHVPARIRRSTTLPKLGASRRTPAIAFRLSERAKVTLTFARRDRRGKFRTLHTRPLRISARAGTNRLRFGGRLTRKTRLAAGRYRITLTATDAAANRSTAKTIMFRIG